jgi:translation initiation factor 6
MRCRVGVFSTLTNSYALVAVGASENFYRYVLLTLLLRTSNLDGGGTPVGNLWGKGNGNGIEADQNSVFEAELQDVIPICHATIAGTRIIGRLTAGYVYTQVEKKWDRLGGTQC